MYYAPRRPVYAEATPPTLFGGFALLREVVLRERITLLHAHQAFSAIAHEALLHARTMGCRVGLRAHAAVRGGRSRDRVNTRMLMVLTK